jgi:hypothetical protein
LFAIAGSFFDQRDKITGNITGWGRTFLWLTVISSVAGFLAQEVENSAERAKDRAAQEKMTRLLENTQTAVAQLSRSMQTLGQPSVQVWMKIDCQLVELTSICKRALDSNAAQTADRIFAANSGTSQRFSIEIPDVEWSSLGEIGSYFSFTAQFYRSREDAMRFIKSGCRECITEGDLRVQFSTKFATTRNGIKY